MCAWSSWIQRTAMHRSGENLLSRIPGSAPSCAGARENTIASFRRAVQENADFIEFDVQVRRTRTTMTADMLRCPMVCEGPSDKVVVGPMHKQLAVASLRTRARCDVQMRCPPLEKIHNFP
jgi:hypothetical protein